MNRELQSLVLVLVGAAVLKISVGDTYLRYVREGMQPLLVASGAVLLLLGLAAAWQSTRDIPQPDADHADGPRVAWALLLPVLALFLVAPPALGADAAARDSGVVAAPVQELTDEGFPPVPPGEVVELPLPEYAVRAGWGGANTLVGRTLSLTGFVTPADGGGWHVTRMSLSCCAADAQAVKVRVLGPAAPPTDTWVQVVGTYEPSGAADPRQEPPVIRVSQVLEVSAPVEPYV